MYKIKRFDGDYNEILTNAVDEINDSLIFYIDSDFKTITDDGYIFNEFEMMSSKLTPDEKTSICTKIARFYFCDFDKNNEEIYKSLDLGSDLDDAVMSMIQVSTAIATLINFGGIK